MNKVLTWRLTIQKSDLQATTRLVLLNLSIYMDADGKSCFPTTLRQASDTGLAEKSIITHLDKAVVAGFLKKSVRGRGGKGWAAHEYQAILPQGAEPISVPEHVNFSQATEPISVAKGAGAELGVSKPLNEVQSNSPNKPHKKELTYFWSGEILRLTEKDFRAWQRVAEVDEDTLAEYLLTRDMWLRGQSQGVQGSWFISTMHDIKNRFKKSGT